MNHLRKYNEEFIGGPKMYHFIQNSYNMEFTVLATSKEEALDNLKNGLKEKNTFKYSVSDYEIELWEKSSVDNLPDGYEIKELKLGEVLVTEVS